MHIRFFIYLLSFISLQAYAQSDSTSEQIRKASEHLRLGNQVVIRGEKVHCKTLLPEFYQRNVFQPAWDKSDKVALLKVLSDTELDGLHPADYHYALLDSLRPVMKSPEERAELDMLFTDAFLLYASHYLNGKVNPETVDSEWKAIRREGNAREFLENALASDQVEEVLRSLEPDFAGYAALRDALARYREVKARGGWESIPEGTTLKPGMTDSLRLPILAKRLLLTGDLSAPLDDEYVLSSAMVEAIKAYQKRNGLEVDGALGKQTVESLNVPVEVRIDQIIANMERYRWISQNLGQHYVMVNIADFSMKAYRSGQETYRESVIVGKTYRKTPVFSSKMTYIVLNPYWVVPPTILFNDILPEVQKNAGYLNTKNIKVLQGFGTSSEYIDPLTIEWSKYSKGYFPFTLRQEPGPTNALGQVKFMFPNTYNVYMHDTPSKELFQKTDRAFSSGCIRLRNPMDFAYYLLQDQPRWNKENVQKVLKEGKEQTILLKEHVGVHVLYLTSWIDEGVVHFRKDIYARDLPLITALKQSSPTI